MNEPTLPEPASGALDTALARKEWQRYRNRPAAAKSTQGRERSAFLAGHKAATAPLTEEQVAVLTLTAAQASGVSLTQASDHWPGFVGFAQAVLEAAGHTRLKEDSRG